ncbi:hypothetical protein FDI69_gp054 [Rhodococcus phage Trina]|uniref:Uncharacterized protein n=1 Tax=Rhodococcus phage Trina TaxID=2027905 RepID=A0A2D1A6I2_9CAUD|nr:hypothetical protein FDI69_gp054 [Rhodococcus phage Trina]ASZ74870.1 hypothetical protein SEA_TRINA_54 [Rhodococcus phage Trina]
MYPKAYHFAEAVQGQYRAKSYRIKTNLEFNGFKNRSVETGPPT